jgi:nucleoside-diphosphate-sugar epimerase
MRIVVTGAQGFVGRHMVARLSQAGASVVGLDSKAAQGPAPAGVTLLPCDVRATETYRASLESADVVVHMASAHLDVGLPESTYQAVNVDSLRPLLEAARRAGVRHFLHTSSVGVHGSLTRVPGDEDAAIAPDNLYEKTKAAGEEEVRRFLPEAPPMGVTIVRPAWIYGVGDARTERILRAVAAGRFVMFGSGRNHRHPIHISDYLDGIDRLLLQPQTFGRTYILAGPSFMTTRELLGAAERVTGGRIRLRVPMAAGWSAGLVAEALGRLLGVSPPISRRTLAFFRSENGFDTSRARAEFGFDPKVGLEEGLRRTWEAIRRG